MLHPLLKSIGRIHTTPLGRLRIARNLCLDADRVVEWCQNAIASPGAAIVEAGKNWYVRANGCVITVHKSSFTVITARRERGGG